MRINGLILGLAMRNMVVSMRPTHERVVESGGIEPAALNRQRGPRLTVMGEVRMSRLELTQPLD